MERRLAAILVADMVGYSRLMEVEEDATIARQKRYRDQVIEPAIAEHRGRLIKTMGDGLLIEFASVVDAVDCAVKIQRSMAEREAEAPPERRIRYRMGLNLGDVVVEGDDLYGDGVNVAARLEQLAEPGGLIVSGTAYDLLKGKVAVGYQYLGEQRLKNIAQPLRTYRVLIEPGAAVRVIGETRHRPRRARTVAFAAALLGRPWAPEIRPASVARMAFPLPDKPSIAVLPFANMSGDSDQDYFADGITEDIITDLSKISGLFVIARNSTFAYKGHSVEVRRVAEDLGVRYVLEGSVRRAGDQVRINAQLIDATTGGHVWADRYDSQLTDVFSLQDAVTRKIVAALAVSLTADEEVRQAQRHTENAEAYDAFLQGWEFYQRFSADDFAKAIPHFERAVQLDPDYGQAYAALALVYWQSVRQGDPWTSKVSPDEFNFVSFTTARAKAERYAELAMLNPSPLAYRVASAISWSYRQFDDAVAEAEQAVSLDPNDPDGQLALAWAMIFNGRPQDALTAVERAMRLDPRNPGAYLYILGVTRFGLDQFDDAIESLERAQARSPEFLGLNIPLAAAYAHRDRQAAAQAALQRYTDVWRTFALNVDGILEWWPYRREVDLRRLGEGLVDAGLCCEIYLEQYLELVRRGGTLE